MLSLTEGQKEWASLLWVLLIAWPLFSRGATCSRRCLVLHGSATGCRFGLRLHHDGRAEFFPSASRFKAAGHSECHTAQPTGLILPGAVRQVGSVRGDARSERTTPSSPPTHSYRISRRPVHHRRDEIDLKTPGSSGTSPHCGHAVNADSQPTATCELPGGRGPGR